MILSLATLAMGMIIGYLGQRSGFCSTGSIQNFLITKDLRFLRETAAFTVAAVAGYFVMSSFGVMPGFPAFARAEDPVSIYGACIDPYGGSNVPGILVLTVAGGFGVGLFSVIAGGCPFRQHIRASEGDRGSVAFVMGFYLAAIAAGFILK